MACIAMAVVDGDGNLVHHQHYPKPYPFAHLEALNCHEFASLTLTQLHEAGDSSLDCGPGEYPYPELQNALILAKHVATYSYVLWHVACNISNKILYEMCFSLVKNVIQLPNFVSCVWNFFLFLVCEELSFLLLIHRDYLTFLI